jgi:hypothetical protein
VGPEDSSGMCKGTSCMIHYEEQKSRYGQHSPNLVVMPRLAPRGPTLPLVVENSLSLMESVPV